MTDVKIMRRLATIAAVLFFCALLPVAALFHAVDTTALDAGFVRDETQRLDVPVIAREMWKEQIAAGEPLDRLVLEIVIRAWDADAQAQLSKVVEGIHDYLTGRSEQVDVPLNFVGYKARLLKIAKEEMPAMLPPEVAREIAALTLPEREEALAQLEQQLISGLSEQIQLPSRLTREALPKDMQRSLESAREAIGVMQQMRLGVFVLLGVLAGVILWLGSWRWLGGACLLGAALVGLVRWGLEEGFAQSLTTNEAQSVPAPVRTWLAELLGRIIAPMQTGVFLFVAVGLGLLLIAVWPTRRPPPPV